MSCNSSNAISFGNPGKNGVSAYIYVAYADDVVAGTPDTVTNFSYNVPQTTTKWMAFKNTAVQITNPVESDFQGLWVQVAGVGISPDTNVYNTDGTLEGNRTIDADSNTLTINNLTGFVINGLFYPIVDGTTGQVLVTDGGGILQFIDPINIYNSDGTLTNARVINGDGNTLDIVGTSGVNITSEGDVIIKNNLSPTTFITLYNDTLQFNSGDGLFYSYTNDFSVLANNDLIIDASNTGRIGCSSGGNVGRVYFSPGDVTIDATGNLNVNVGGVLAYKLPLTTPTAGQVLTALDGAGTLGWV